MPVPVTYKGYARLLDPDIAAFLYYSATDTTSTPDNTTQFEWRMATKTVFEGCWLKGELDGKSQPELYKRYDFYNQI